MRELTKSIFSFSWAMSLFGIQQTTNLTSPEKAAQSLKAVTQATEGQFDEVLKSTFRMGDKLQRSALDLTLGMISGGGPNANQWMRTFSDAAKQSSEVATRAVQGVTASVTQAASSVASQNGGTGFAPGSGDASAASQKQGWGPMPS